jgi:hypothetical protein
MSWSYDHLKAILAVLCLGCLAAAAGCASTRAPLQVDVTQIGPYTHAAKGPDCEMPVLEEPPTASYRQVAIVEAWADIHDDASQVLPALKRKACETGADALLIVNARHQDLKSMLYAANPNDTSMSQTETGNAYNDPGAYIRTMEHMRRIGEVGHSGYYIDAVAIDYVHGNGTGSGH